MEALESHLRRQIDHSQQFFWHRLRWRLVRKYLPANRRFSLIDIGAGAGILGAFLGREFPQADYRFIEPLGSLEDHLSEQYGQRSNGRELTSFDGIAFATMLDVLEHIEDDRRFLGDVVQKMEPGSMALISVPALPMLWSNWDVALGHHRRYRKLDIRRLISDLPLEIAELSYVFPELIPPALVRRLRMRASAAASSDHTAEFPDIPAFVNDALFGIGRLSLAARRFWPAGTSLYGAVRRV